ncbi:MAG: hypothetical protein AB1757_06020 [Acidobacteriota bacterium]
MRISKILLLIAIAVLALSHKSDGQQARPVSEQLRLAAVMPRGAMVYLQARDLSLLMKTWLASPVHNNFYESASFKNFEKSNVALKFQSRKEEFEKALGFSVDEARLANLAGGASAVAIYDIGKLELVFVTEVTREKALLNTLFQNLPQFQERPAKDGSYYVREVTTDAGRLTQQFCFAHVDGKLIVTTTEGLMIRALANAKAAGEDALLSDVLAITNQARSFNAQDVTLWLDQTKLNRNQLFRSYWIYGNIKAQSADSLAKIESGLINLKFETTGITEQRWFKLAGSERVGHLNSEQSTAFLKFAPRDAQLVEMHASSGAALNEIASQTLFGKAFDEKAVVPENQDNEDSDSDESESRSARRAERYANLDARFDKDVDDAQAKSKNKNPQSAEGLSLSRNPQVTNPLEPILNPAVSYAEMARSKDEVGKPFVHFERAVVIEMNGTIDKAALERTIAAEMRERFVVAGIDPQLVWQDEGSVRFLAQSLLEQGAAYAISGKYLVLSSSKEFARDILQAAQTADARNRLDGDLEFYAIVRLAAAKPVFDKLMRKLDGKVDKPVAKKTDDEEAGDEEIKFFSDNLSSFVSASAIREMRVRRNSAAGILAERVVYTY